MATPPHVETWHNQTEQTRIVLDALEITEAGLCY